jgi:hypothetical protein
MSKLNLHQDHAIENLPFETAGLHRANNSQGMIYTSKEALERLREHIAASDVSSVPQSIDGDADSISTSADLATKR